MSGLYFFIKAKFFELDPVFMRLEHSLKVAIISMISGAVALLVRKPEIYWLVLTATLMPDVIYTMQGIKAHVVYWVCAILIALFLLILSPLGQFEVAGGVCVFIFALIGLSIPIFDRSIFPLGLYIAIFAILAIMHFSDGYLAMNAAISSIAGSVLAYLLYYLIGFNFPYLAVRAHLRKSIADISNLLLKFNVSENEFYQARLHSWKSTQVIRDLTQALAVTLRRKKRTQQYYETLWAIRRRLTLLHGQLSLIENDEAAVYSNLEKLGGFLKELTIPYESKGESFPVIDGQLPAQLQVNLQQIFSTSEKLYELIKESEGT